MMKLIFLLVIFCLPKNYATAVSPGNECLKEGEIIAVHELCDHYLECQGGVYVIKHCAFGEYFSTAENDCIWAGSFSIGCHHECSFTNKKPVKGSNNKYIYCENGVVKKGNCKGHFDRLIKKCVSVSRLHTAKREFHSPEYYILASNNPLITSDELITNFPFTEEPFTTFSSSSDGIMTTSSDTENPMTTFSTTEEPFTTFSSSERPVTSFTPTEEVITTFSPSDEPIITSTSTEEIITLYPSTSWPEPTEGSSTNTPTTKMPTITTSKHTTTQAPECTKDGQKKVYKTGDCKDYLECDSGQWVEKSCWWGFDFDLNKLECTWNWWAKC